MIRHIESLEVVQSLARRFESFDRIITMRRFWQALIIVGTLYLARAIGVSGVDPSRLLIMLIGIGLLVVILSGNLKRTLFLGYLFWIATLAVGWRGLWASDVLRFYAAEVIIWGLFVLILSQSVLQRLPLNVRVPPALLIVIIPFGILGVLTAFTQNTPSDNIWAEYKEYLMIVPVFAVTWWLITDLQKWKTSAIVFGVTMAVIAVLGIIEFVTQSSLNIFGSTDMAVTLTTQLGFTRAYFTFWGHPSVAVLLVLGIGLVLPLLFDSMIRRRLWYGVVIALVSAGVYVSGSRGMWIGLGLLLLVFIVLNVRRRWSLAIPYGIGLLLVPASFYNNLMPIFFGVQQYNDTSIIKRLSYNSYAISTIENNPLQGIGWGGSGWVHNDFLQLGAGLGLPALIIFILWFANLMRELLQLSFNGQATVEQRTIAAALLGTLAGLVIMMNSEVVMPLAPVAVGVWGFLALVTRFVTLTTADLKTTPDVRLKQEFDLAPADLNAVDA